MAEIRGSSWLCRRSLEAGCGRGIVGGGSVEVFAGLWMAVIFGAAFPLLSSADST